MKLPFLTRKTTIIQIAPDVEKLMRITFAIAAVAEPKLKVKEPKHHELQ